jgi:hypothetical protein
LTAKEVRPVSQPASVKRCPHPEHEGERLLPVSAFNKNQARMDGLESWCRACMRRQKSLRRDQLRDQVLDHYGRVCACPGCGATEDLTIDHVNGDGRAHRAGLFGEHDSSGGADSERMYCWLIRNGFPDGFQVLCRSCNARKANGSVCGLDHDAVEAGMKRCPHEDHFGPNPLPLSEFGKDRNRRDGHQSWCRSCTNRHNRSRIASRRRVSYLQLTLW